MFSVGYIVDLVNFYCKNDDRILIDREAWFTAVQGSAKSWTHLGCFHVLAIINSASMNIGVHVSLSILVSSVCMPSSGIAGS